MKKLFKRILVAIGLFILLIMVLGLVFFLKFKSETKGMNDIETKEVVRNIFSIKDAFVNMFLIKDSSQFVAIDAGNNLENVAAELKKLNINPDKIVAVFLTHTDRDHVAALKLFRNARVYFSKPEVQMLNGTKHKFLLFGNSIYTKEYTLLDDGQTLNIGNIKVTGILTPGHTSGSMCYLINDKYLFTGDALGLKDGKIHPFNKFFNMDSKAALKSMDNIAHLPNAEYIFTAHYGYTSDYKNAVTDWEKAN